jgi:hypothetical protein
MATGRSCQSLSAPNYPLSFPVRPGESLHAAHMTDTEDRRKTIWLAGRREYWVGRLRPKSGPKWIISKLDEGIWMRNTEIGRPAHFQRPPILNNGVCQWNGRISECSALTLWKVWIDLHEMHKSNIATWLIYVAGEWGLPGKSIWRDMSNINMPDVIFIAQGVASDYEFKMKKKFLLHSPD